MPSVRCPARPLSHTVCQNSIICEIASRSSPIRLANHDTAPVTSTRSGELPGAVAPDQPTGVEWVAAQQPPDRQTGSPERAVSADRLQGISAARRVEPTARRQRRAYPTTVRDDGSGNSTRAPAFIGGPSRLLGPRARASVLARDRGARSFEPAYAPAAAAVPGRRPVDAGGRAARCDPDQVPEPPFHHVTDDGVADGLGHDEAGPRRLDGARSGPAQTRRRRVRGCLLAPASMVDCRSDAPRGLRDRRGDRYEWWRRSLRAAPQTLSGRQHDCLPNGPRRLRPSRPPGGRAPWRDAPTGWHGRHGCACAAGSRGSSRAGGCSAGRCACSRRASVFVAGVGLVTGVYQGKLPQPNQGTRGPTDRQRWLGTPRNPQVACGQRLRWLWTTLLTCPVAGRHRDDRQRDTKDNSATNRMRHRGHGTASDLQNLSSPTAVRSNTARSTWGERESGRSVHGT